MNVFLTPNPIGVLDRQGRGLKNIDAYIKAIENGGMIIIPEDEETDIDSDRYTESYVMVRILYLIKEGFLDSLPKSKFNKDKWLTKIRSIDKPGKKLDTGYKRKAHKEQLLAVLKEMKSMLQDVHLTTKSWFEQIRDIPTDEANQSMSEAFYENLADMVEEVMDRTNIFLIEIGESDYADCD